ncbi:betaine--homocysteine S-methyltransferase [Halovulum dunhuangense]|uniref:Betaine--homocysteine S-methyltransferase n=1 Tax=Halovulum dunhuangense TaxID=1505036 RepID=A0A849L2Z8_9RHOB|nr:betaine--homocysteine S-methyltransferase [Halovulum dunhuangense]NNU80610.1 betaine--homocysteine S-methyltransferase [Halovulum dunhuangense]
MRISLEQLLAQRDWILTDGATGTNLFNAGLPAGEAPELWNTENPDAIRALYRSAVDAGSDLFLTNTFGGNASRLKLHNAAHRVYELNRAAALLGREVADASPRPIVVAGSMGPTGEIMQPVGSLSEADAADMFEEQARGLMDGGADVLWVETISAPEELRAAAIGIARVGAPWCCTMSFDTAGRTMMGVTSAGMVALIEELPHRPIAFGANCGVGASDLLRTVRGMHLAGATLPLIAKGNAGVPKFVEGHVHYNGTPALMADYARLAMDCGARIIGGCCGTGPEHLGAMHDALGAHRKGAVPELETIAERVGGFSSDVDGTGDNDGGERRVRRRRRG